MRSSKTSELKTVKARRQTVKNFISDTIVFIIGGTLYSIAVNCFTSRNDILNGGFTGIATLLNFLFNVPIGTAVFLMNIPLFILAYKKLGGKFVMRTAYATFIMSVMIDIGTLFPIYRKDLLLSSIFGGALSGAALGIIFIRNATTGGTDIIAKLIGIHFPHISIGQIILIADIVIVLLGGLVYRNVESMLYASIVIFLSTQTIDYIIYGVNRSSMIMIITETGEQLRKMILSELNRGVTVIKGHGGYTDGQKDILICACYDNQTGKFIKKIKSADENAFFIITQSKQILGNGFKQ